MEVPLSESFNLQLEAFMEGDIPSRDRFLRSCSAEVRDKVVVGLVIIVRRYLETQIARCKVFSHTVQNLYNLA